MLMLSHGVDDSDDPFCVSFQVVLVVGAIQAAQTGVLGALGAVVVYRRNPVTLRWGIAQSLPRPDNVTPTSFGNFGWDVAIAKDQTIYVGAP